MKLLAVCAAVAAALAFAAPPSRAAIPVDGGYSDGLRVAYEMPITSRSAVVRERYQRCGSGRGGTAGTTTDRWCRFMPSLRPAPRDATPSSAGDEGNILSVPLADWRPL